MAPPAAEVYTVGTAVWVRSDSEVWAPGKVKTFTESAEDVSVGTVSVSLHDDNSQVVNVVAKSASELPPLRNPDILVGSDDLTDLSHLHEPAVLHNVGVRFCDQEAIYTYCGIVLVAINPYKRLPLYGSDVLHAYSGRAMGELDPHIFAIAEEAFRCMARQGRNQSIIVSGESGAGKTVSAKYAMRYFATVGGAEAETQIEKKVLASNPIMEAIGNAKTTRNDNSSRFGKYIEIQFNTEHHIVGANMRTYLLEKSRVVFQAETERAYHIFYQLCACADEPELANLELGDAEDFRYTNQGGDSRIVGVDDVKEFAETRASLSLLGVSDADQLECFSLLAGILHLGNVDIVQKSRRQEVAKIEEADSHAETVARLLGLDQKLLVKWLTHRKINAGSEVVTKPLTVTDAIRSRDALAKHIYARFFDWVVARVNESLVRNDNRKGGGFIGVLDIYGFETFKINSFEQFCINYANEKLQQQFNQHVFKLEQEEYVREEIAWSFIDFYDNQPCIDLIEERLGILRLLDEECKLPKGSDDNWSLKMFERLESSEHFCKPRIGKGAFIVKHYAEDVTYTAEGFLEKNKDTLYEEHLLMLRASSLPLLSTLFSDSDASAAAGNGKNRGICSGSGAGGGGGAGKGKRATVGAQFQASLSQLMETLDATEPHYVRCIKPNDTKEAFGYNRVRVLQQLRACGVLETIRISAAGYPSRWAYDEFLDRYRMLGARGDANLVPGAVSEREACGSILSHVIESEDAYQCGKTKIFFRAGQVAYLEKRRATTMKAAVIIMQAAVRGWLQARKYHRIRRAVLALQAAGRGMLARILANQLRKTRAATCIQAAVRAYMSRRRYLRAKNAVLVLQKIARGMAARAAYRKLLRHDRARRIQSFVRMWVIRRKYVQQQRAAVTIQCAWRSVCARRELRALKIEARTVAGIKAKTVGLEKKIMEMQQKLDAKVAAVKEAKDAEIKGLEAQLEKAAKAASQGTAAAGEEVEALRRENEQLRAEATSAIERATAAETELAAQQTTSKASIAELEARVKELEPAARTAAALAAETETELKRLRAAADSHSVEAAEIDSERGHHQRKLQELNGMEARIAQLEAQLKAAEGEILKAGGTVPVPASTASAAVTASTVTASEGVGNGDDAKARAKAERVARLKAAKAKRAQLAKKAAETPVDQAELIRARKLVAVAKAEVAEERAKAEAAEAATAKAHKRMAELQAENKELMLAEGETTFNVAGVGGDGSGDGGGGGDAELRKGRADIARLRLANTKLKQRVEQLERDVVVAESRSARAGVGTGAEEQQALRDKVAELAGRLNEMVPRVKVEAIKAERDALQQRLEALEADYEAFMTENAMLDLAKAKTALQEEKGALTSEVTTLKQEMALVKEEAAAAAAEATSLRAERGKQNDRILSLEKALVKKLPVDGSGGSVTARLQEEIGLLINENLEMREQIEELEQRLKASAGAGAGAGGALGAAAATSSGVAAGANGKSDEVRHVSATGTTATPAAPGALGMLKYAEKNIQLIVNALVTDLAPEAVEREVPGLPAHLLFMCVLYADHVENTAMMHGMLHKTFMAVKQVVMTNTTNLHVLGFWLTNAYRLLCDMKQFSGEQQFRSRSDTVSASLRSFDLGEYRNVLTDLLVQIYHTIVKHVEVLLVPLIVPAMLDYEPIPSMGTSPAKLGGRRKPKASHTVESILKLLTKVMVALRKQCVEPALARQVFRQVFYVINAHIVNSFLLSKDYCHCFKGVQVRFNITKLQEWARENQLDDAGEVLKEAVQVTQLLQVNKTSLGDVDTILDCCEALSPVQVQKILTMYTPGDFEERVPASVIRAVTQRGSQNFDPSKLMLETKVMFPVSFPYNPSAPKFPNLSLPAYLGLEFAKKI